MAKKSLRSAINSIKDFDREWQQSSIDEILSQDQIHDFIEKAYNNNTEPSRIYANVEFRKISESYMKRINEVIVLFRKKEREIERISRVTKVVLNEKIKKIDVLVNYVKLLEKMLNDNGIALEKPLINDNGDLVFFDARKNVIDEEAFSTGQGEYVEAEEIVLNEEASPVSV